ncbi:hypothetical protein GW891_00760 [bacterium]|nr:hypothetical protein [bacterium]
MASSFFSHFVSSSDIFSKFNRFASSSFFASKSLLFLIVFNNSYLFGKPYIISSLINFTFSKSLTKFTFQFS